ncbi:MAG: acetyl-CoA decarbonylase/synthase complex subunit gamma [Bacillota bacterium]
MGLSGLDIYKQLPKKNCGECGPPTCLAFAMSLAAGKASLDACPYVSDTARDNLASASAPPIKLVTVGSGPAAIQLGDETVLYRHDKTFVHPTGIFVEIRDDMDDAALDARLDQLAAMVFERVGQQYHLSGLAVRYVMGDPGRFAEVAVRAHGKFQRALILGGCGPGLEQALEKALETLAAAKPLLYAATVENHEGMTALAKKHACPLVVRGESLDATAELAQKVSASHKELVLDTGARQPSRTIADQTHIRRLAIKKKFRPLGYPTIAFTTSEDPGDEIVEATALVAKYTSVVVLKAHKVTQLLPLLSWRQNIYTDPQKPIQVQSQLYEVGQVTADSPVYVTTNFSLTYFSVEGEVQASKIPGYIIAVDTDGTSVLTAWAAGKLTSEAIAKMLGETGIESKVTHRKVVLPGHVAVLSGKLQELSGWQVLVGPREAAGIPSFAKSKFA